MPGERTETKPPLTARRGFVVGTSLGVLSLYGLWAAYGAAPGLFGHESHEGHDEGEAGGHGEHGGHGSAAMPDNTGFRAAAEAFNERYRLPDGSVQPPVPEGGAADMPMPMVGHEGHAGMAMPGMASPAHEHDAVNDDPPATAGEAVDAYLLVQQWLFEPAALRLAAGVPYRLRMLALDVSHGASLQLGLGSRIVRLRPDLPTDLLVRFERPGDYLLYCTVYCGLGHDQMHGRIIVT
jgi:heme/copper-type cytochrome/quinol oxidase subunit 2